MMPKLSVIVPVYNTEKYLSDCIASVLSQTYHDFELILVDDGSTDGSGAVCEQYARTDRHIRVIHQENAGVTRARKVGVAFSKGEYVTFVDSDDWIDPDTYGHIMGMILNNNADVGIFAMMLEHTVPQALTNGVGVGVFAGEQLRDAVHSKMLFDYSRNCSGIIPSLCNKIIRRDLLQNAIEAIPDDLVYGEDAIAGYLSILNASVVYVCNTPFYHYRDNPSSISHAGASVMKKRILALDREMRSCFSGYEPDLSSQIDGHITRHTIEHTRNVLLYTHETAISERVRTARDFCALPSVASALERALPEICDVKEKIKVLLIRYKLFHLLYLLFKKV